MAGGEAPKLSAEELDGLLVTVATACDRQAFTLLYGHFAPRLKAFLLKSGLTGNMAEEIAQETMLAVWRKASYFDPQRAGAATWIFTIARNLRIDHLRRNRTASLAVPDAPPEQDGSPSGEALMLTAEREARVRAALQALSTEQATIVRLSFFSDKPHSEIARELSLPIGTVKSRVRLALGKLRTMLDGDS